LIQTAAIYTETEITPCCRRGNKARPNEAAAALLLAFVKANEDSLRAHRPESADLREWAQRVSDWLYSTDHIKVAYSLQYDGVDIEQLSPGTRGIVLLLLYLSIDAEDDRPLIIDQPEENLDPQSVFEELVTRFREAKKRRQIIIVTHNANLVVNTDADQVIVASCGRHRPGQLPQISYEMWRAREPRDPAARVRDPRRWRAGIQGTRAPAAPRALTLRSGLTRAS
jgi:hypothetical protein